ncbi:MAG: hypothetical protein H7301_02540 [Cryobacterium sp.]|nr:hypothetical protein [Oligoflexia bacterium]
MNLTCIFPLVAFCIFFAVPFAHANFACSWTLRSAGWTERSSFLRPVVAFKIPAAIVVDGEKELGSLSVISEEFLTQLGTSKVSFEKISASTYAYYPKNPEFPASLREGATSRGGGRDLLVAGPVSLKGSGPNRFFSRSNGNFSIGNFRTNGLVPIVDKNSNFGGGFTEYIVAKNFQEMQIPVIDHGALILIPKTFHPSVSEFAPAQRPIQIVRDLSSMRESMADRVPETDDRIRLAASLVFWNIDHGALNPENLTIDGKLIDLGHVGPGYPVTSGTHRCTICAGSSGSDFDGTHLSVVDYYFPSFLPKRDADRKAVSLNAYRKAVEFARSNTSFLSDSEWKKFIAEFLKPVVSGREFSLSADQIHALQAAVNEAIKLNPASLRSTSSFRNEEGSGGGRIFMDGPGKLSVLQDAILGTSDRAYRNRLEAGSVLRLTGQFENERFALSLRFIAQMAATRGFVSGDEYASNLNKLEGLIEPGKDLAAAHHFRSLISLFETAFSGSAVDGERLRSLFKEYPTAGEIHFGAENALMKLPLGVSDADLKRELQILLEKYRTPKQIDPKSFSRAIRDWQI